MYKIALFLPVIKNNDSLALKKYLELYDKNLCDSPIIFCDLNKIYINKNIPIFSSLYMKQKFIDYIIITDIENINLIDDHTNIIAIYNSICQECASTKSNVYCAPNDSNIEDMIKRISS